jgi:UDP-glucose 6-dehydrogenase
MERIAVIGELNKRSGDLLEGLYSPLCQRNHTPIFRTDLRTAEMAKYAHNLFNAAQISFANETWLVSKELGIDGNQVMASRGSVRRGDVEPSLWYPRWFPLRRQLSTQGYRSFR